MKSKLKPPDRKLAVIVVLVVSWTLVCLGLMARGHAVIEAILHPVAH